MILDCHVHISAFEPGHGKMSSRLISSIPFMFMRMCFGILGASSDAERQISDLLIHTINGAKELDGAVVLAFDAVYDETGKIDLPNTHLYVTNDYVIELARQNPRIFFAASIHPYRKDAVEELDRCVKAGAVMVKWLPIVQRFNPADPKCIPFYEALAHHNIPLLSHTGTENTLPNLDPTVADPMLLLEPLKRGVTIVAAHCGSRLLPWEIDYFGNWCRLAREYENFYGDTAALNVPNRGYPYDTLLRDSVLRSKVIHGSDWPIISLPQPNRLGTQTCLELMRESNWMRRDYLIKKKLGFDDDYFHRAAKLLRISPKAA